MKPIYFVWGLLILIAVLILSAGALVVLSLQNRPLVSASSEFTAAHIVRAQKLLDANDPKNLKNGEVRTLEVSQEDLNLAVNYLASRAPGSAAEIGLQDKVASLKITVKLPSNPVGKYLNIRAVLVGGPGIPKFNFVQVGRVQIPAFVGDWLVAEALKQAQGDKPGPGYADLVQDVRFGPDLLRLTYRWNDAVGQDLKTALVSADEQERWRAHQAKLAELTAEVGVGRSVSFAKLLTSMLRFAKDRSSGADAAAENRAAFVVLGSYLVDKGLDILVPDARNWPRPVGVTVTFAGRDDFPKHYAISAAMAASAGTSFADAVGVYKELKDSQGGSGFSFNDMAADRAGTRLGEVGITPQGAARLQALAAQGFKETDVFPDVSDLPEFLQEADFKAQFGGVGQPEYQKMMDKIEARVAALPVLR